MQLRLRIILLLIGAVGQVKERGAKGERDSLQAVPATTTQ